MERMRKAAIVLNGFVHDFATGYWLASMIVIVFLHRFQGEHPPLAALLGTVQRFFFWNTIGAVVVIFATGGMRSFTYVDNFYGPEAEKARRRMLVAKHIILIILFAIGGCWAYNMAFH